MLVTNPEKKFLHHVFFEKIVFDMLQKLGLCNF